MKVYCNKCPDVSASVEEFEQHWRDQHLALYGWVSASPSIATEWGNGAIMGRDETRADWWSEIDRSVQYVTKYKLSVGAVLTVYGVFYLLFAYPLLHVWDNLRNPGSMEQIFINNAMRWWEYPFLGLSIALLIVGIIVLAHKVRAVGLHG